MNEFIEMRVLREILKTRVDFEKELLETFLKEKNHFGIFGCEMAIRNLNSVLEASETFKTVILEESIA